MKLFTVFAVVLMGVVGSAQAADSFELKSVGLAKAEGSELADLSLYFQDKEPVSGTCALNLVRFEYVEALRALMVQLKPATICPREDFGQRQGQAKWQLPANLYENSNLKIILNGKALSDLKIVKGKVIVKTKP